MSDIVEQAENALAGYPGRYANNRERQVALFPELLAEVKRLRKEVDPPVPPPAAGDGPWPGDSVLDAWR